MKLLTAFGVMKETELANNTRTPLGTRLSRAELVHGVDCHSPQPSSIAVVSCVCHLCMPLGVSLLKSDKNLNSKVNGKVSHSRHSHYGECRWVRGRVIQPRRA